MAKLGVKCTGKKRFVSTDHPVDSNITHHYFYVKKIISMELNTIIWNWHFHTKKTISMKWKLFPGISTLLRIKHPNKRIKHFNLEYFLNYGWRVIRTKSWSSSNCSLQRENYKKRRRILFREKVLISLWKVIFQYFWG